MTAYVENCVFYNFFILSVIYYFTRCMTNTQVKLDMYVYLLIFHFVYLISCCLHAYQIFLKLSLLHTRLCRNNTVIIMFRADLFASGLDYLHCWQTFFLNISLSIELS